MPFSFSEWYKVNGERLNKKRRDRYKTDPEYRSRVLKTNQESRLEKKREAPEPKPAKDKKRKTVEMGVDGIVQQLLTIGAVAEILGCSIQAIRLWEKNGVLPVTPIRGKGGRLYTASMVEEIKFVMGDRTRSRKIGENFKPLSKYVRFSTGKVKETDLYLVGALAEALGKNVAYVEHLEAKGFLPKTPLKVSSVGRRLYTTEMIEAVKIAFIARSPIKGDPAWREFYSDILHSWEVEGVLNATLIETVPDKVEYDEKANIRI